jgi:hypothetical protein
MEPRTSSASSSSSASWRACCHAECQTWICEAPLPPGWCVAPRASSPRGPPQVSFCPRFVFVHPKLLTARHPPSWGPSTSRRSTMLRSSGAGSLRRLTIPRWGRLPAWKRSSLRIGKAFPGNDAPAVCRPQRPPSKWAACKNTVDGLSSSGDSGDFLTTVRKTVECDLQCSSAWNRVRQRSLTNTHVAERSDWFSKVIAGLGFRRKRQPVVVWFVGGTSSPTSMLMASIAIA